MKIGQFGLNLVVAFISFGVLHMLGSVFIYGSALVTMLPHMRPSDDPLQTWVFIGHFLQAVAMVWLWTKGFATKDMGKAAAFGAVFGSVLATTNLVWWSKLNIPTDGMIVTMVSGIIIASLVGMILAKLHNDGLDTSPDE